MKVRIIIFLLVVFFGLWLVGTTVQAMLGKVVIEQQDIVAEGHNAHQQIPLNVLCCIVWAEGFEPRRRRWPYRNPIKRLLKRLRRLAKKQRRAARRAQRKGKAIPVGTGSYLVKGSPVVVSMVEEQAPDAKRRGRPATISTNHVFCPREGCRGYGQLGPHPNHQIVGDGMYHTAWGQRRQMYKCQLCGKPFSETRGTVFFGLKTPEETVYRALACLAEGMSIRSTSRVFQVEVETVLLWLKRAGEHSQQVSSYLMRNLQVEQAQLDELWTFVYKKQKSLSAWEKLHSEYGDTWIWTVFDPVHKLVLAFLIGDREEAQAEGVVKRLMATLVEGCLPLLTSDHLPHYAQAILKVLGHWVQPERKGCCGRLPKKQLEPPDGLQYAIVHKEHQKGRVVSVNTRVVFGKAEDLLARLRSLGMKRINTSFVERMNLSLRHLVSRLRRKGLPFSKKRKFLEWHMQLGVAYYHFVRTHRSLRLRLPQPIPTKGDGSPKKWLRRTPSMSAGLTDHIWTIQELLLFRVPRALTPCA